MKEEELRNTLSGKLHLQALAKIEEQEATIAALRKKLRAANKRLEAFTRQASRSYRDEQDYLPYPEEDRRE